MRVLASRPRRRFVAAVSMGIALASVVGIVSLGAAVEARASAWDGYRAAQTQLDTARQSRDAAAAAYDQARASARTTWQAARDLRDRITAHGVLLTATETVDRLSAAVTSFPSVTGVADTSNDGAATATAAGSGPKTAVQTADATSPTSVLTSAADAATVEVRDLQAQTAALNAKTDAVTAAAASLQASGVAAAHAQGVPAPGEPAVDDPHCASVADGTRTVWVSIADQHLWACDGRRLKLDSAVTTGATAITNVDDATPTGTFSILGKTGQTVLRGADANGSWTDPVTYWIPFADGIGFHDAPWQTFPYGSAQYTTDGSHGCVHTPEPVLAQLSAWLRIGDRVVVG